MQKSGILKECLINDNQISDDFDVMSTQMV